RVELRPPPKVTTAAVSAEEKRGTVLQVSTDDNRSLLGIAPSQRLSADLVRRQYRLLSARYTPDALKAMGIEFVDMAHQKREAVRLAAEALLARLGEKLEEDPPSTPASE